MTREFEQKPYDRVAAALRMVKRSASIQDVRQRSFVLAERLALLENPDLLAVVAHIVDGAVEGDEEFAKLYNGLLNSDVLAGVLGARRMSELVLAAQERGEIELTALLMELPAERRPEGPSQPYLDPDLKETTLGMRKSLARKPDFNMVEKISRDQDHRVIRNLLNNPRLIESDVMRIGSARPVSEQVLKEIYNHPKWIQRYRVKKVIVSNPYAPLSMALRLLTFLSAQDLKGIYETPGLSDSLRRRARSLAQKKGLAVKTADEEGGDGD